MAKKSENREGKHMKKTSKPPFDIDPVAAIIRDAISRYFEECGVEDGIDTCEIVIEALEDVEREFQWRKYELERET